MKKIGSIQKVIIDGREKGNYYGRTQHDAPDVDNLVYFKAEKPLNQGEFANVKIDRAEEYDLFGRMV